MARSVNASHLGATTGIEGPAARKSSLEGQGYGAGRRKDRNVRVIELLGKELGMFIDRKEVGGPNEFACMSDEELDAFLRESIESFSLLHNGRSRHQPLMEASGLGQMQLETANVVGGRRVG
jgi:hypothetical protein